MINQSNNSEISNLFNHFNSSLLRGKRTIATKIVYHEIWKIIQSFPNKLKTMPLNQFIYCVKQNLPQSLTELYILWCVYLYHQLRSSQINIQNIYYKQCFFSWYLKKINVTKIKYCMHQTTVEYIFSVPRKVICNDSFSITIRMKSSVSRYDHFLSSINSPSDIYNLYNKINAYDCSLLKYLQILIYIIKNELLDNDYLNVKKQLSHL